MNVIKIDIVLNIIILLFLLLPTRWFQEIINLIMFPINLLYYLFSGGKCLGCDLGKHNKKEAE